MRRGSSTLLIGLDDDQVDQAMQIIRDTCSITTDPNQKRATVFVLNVAKHIGLLILLQIMINIIRSIAIILTIVVVGTGCSSSPVPVQTPDKSAVLATMIQETMQSMQGSIPTTTTSPDSPEPEEPTATLESQVQSLLPHSLYFLAPGTNGKDQIWRMNKNGSGISVLTAEANGIESYDFSKSNGLLAYLTNNRVVIADSEGKIIRVLVEGPPNDGKDIWYITRRD